MIELRNDEDNPTRLWAEIWKLRSEAKGPDGFDTWRDAAIAEKRKRIVAEQKLAEIKHELSLLQSKF